MCACCPHLTRLGKGCHLCSRSYGIVFYPRLVCRSDLRVVGAACDWQYQERHESSGWLLTGPATTAWRTTPKNCDWRFSDAWGMAYPRRRPWRRQISSERERPSRLLRALEDWKIFQRTSGAETIGHSGLWSCPRTLARFLADPSLPLPVKLCTINTILASSPFVEADGLIACCLPRKKDSTLDVLTKSLNTSQRLSFGESADLVEVISTGEPPGFIGRKPEQL
jgi:hypothetical protein